MENQGEYERFNVGGNVAIVGGVDVVDEAIDECLPLDGKGANEKVEAHTAETIPLEEGHKEAEADEHHDVNILEHCEQWVRVVCWEYVVQLDEMNQEKNIVIETYWSSIVQCEPQFCRFFLSSRYH